MEAEYNILFGNPRFQQFVGHGPVRAIVLDPDWNSQVDDTVRLKLSQ